MLRNTITGCTGIFRESWPPSGRPDAQSAYKALIREELVAMVHGEVDDESWQAKQCSSADNQTSSAKELCLRSMSGNRLSTR